jgi:hypothetical protein
VSNCDQCNTQYGYTPQVLSRHEAHSDHLGVITRTGPKGEQLEVTDLESTLIDIAVPPAYADGVTSALRTYTRASKGRSQILPKREEGTESLRTVIGKAKAREPKSSSRTAPNECSARPEKSYAGTSSVNNHQRVPRHVANRSNRAGRIH